jgi:hypothetical protein
MSLNKSLTANNFDKHLKEVTRYIQEDPRSNFIKDIKEQNV